MTSLVVLDLIDDFGSPIFALDAQIKVTPSAHETNGTTANLIAHDILTVNELMYGLMLPSGNDAAQALALYFGAALHGRTNKVSPNQWLFEVDDAAVESRIAEERQKYLKAVAKAQQPLVCQIDKSPQNSLQKSTEGSSNTMSTGDGSPQRSPKKRGGRRLSISL